MNKIVLFLKKNIATTLLSTITITVVLNVGGQIIDTLNKVEIILERDSLALLTLEAELAGVRTPEEVDELVCHWREEELNVQLASLKSVSNSDMDRVKLRDRVFSDEVYKAIMGHAIFK